MKMKFVIEHDNGHQVIGSESDLQELTINGIRVVSNNTLQVEDNLVNPDMFRLASDVIN